MKPKQYEDQLKDLLDRVEGMSGEELYDMVDFTLRSIRPEDRGQYATLENMILGESEHAVLSAQEIYNSEEYWREFDRLCGIAYREWSLRDLRSLSIQKILHNSKSHYKIIKVDLGPDFSKICKDCLFEDLREPVNLTIKITKIL